MLYIFWNCISSPYVNVFGSCKAPNNHVLYYLIQPVWIIVHAYKKLDKCSVGEQWTNLIIIVNFVACTLKADPDKGVVQKNPQIRLLILYWWLMESKLGLRTEFNPAIVVLNTGE